MTEIGQNQIPETYITDYDKSLEIAYASKLERCMIVASKLVDKIFEPIESEQHVSLEREAAIATEIANIYAIYPEAFNHIIEPGELDDTRVTLSKLYLIDGHGGIPVKQRGWNDYYKVSLDKLEYDASLKEIIASALYDTPPSDDFRNAFKSDVRHDNEEASVDSVFYLLTRIEEIQDEVKRVDERTSMLQEILESRTGSERLNLLTTYIRDLSLELDRKDGNHFEARIAAAAANHKTTIGDLTKLWLWGRSEIVEISLRKARRAQFIFGMITTGKAATWLATGDNEQTLAEQMNTGKVDG